MPFGKEGDYKGADAPLLEEKPTDKVQLRLDPVSIPELKDFQPGDTVDLTLKVKLGAPGEDGMSDAEVLRVSAEAMAPAAKGMRQMMGKRAPDMSGTSMEEEA